MTDRKTDGRLRATRHFNRVVPGLFPAFTYIYNQMIKTVKNGSSVELRRLQQQDREALYRYLTNLSPESRSRFGPHPFDKHSIDTIFDQPEKSLLRYVAVDVATGTIVAYMLIKQGMIPGDKERYEQRNQFFDPGITVTFAPSVADDWQSSGLGMALTDFIESELKERGIRYVVLWAGVQATNTRAVNFYKKLGYRYLASFWFDNKDNHDMVKELPM